MAISDMCLIKLVEMCGFVSLFIAKKWRIALRFYSQTGIKAQNYTGLGEMDSFDLKILRILEVNGRITNSELSERVGLSKTPCQIRVKNMVTRGVIKGFRAVLDNDALDRNHISFTEVKLNDTRDASLRLFNKAVLEIPEIVECHMIAGKFDYLLKVRTKNISDYRIALGEKISGLPCVANTSTHVAMEAVKE
jgi:Lrp/AsnC family leucine-responsive transcriptional regulator